MDLQQIESYGGGIAYKIPAVLYVMLVRSQLSICFFVVRCIWLAVCGFRIDRTDITSFDVWFLKIFKGF